MAFSFSSLLQNLQAQTSAGPQRVVGIDLGSSSIKVVELQLKEESIVLTSYGELQLGPYGEVDLGQAVNLPEVKKIEALVDVIRESGITAKDGVLALPLSSSFVTVISLPESDEGDIASRVRVEARKYIPVPIADVVLDWTELDTIGDVQTEMQEVLVAAIQNDALSKMNDVMQAVSMVSQPSEIEIFGSIRALHKESHKAVAILDLGARTSKMYLAAAGQLHRLHRVPAGGVQATEKIAELLSTSFLEAENKKRNYTPDDPDAAEIKKAIITHYERPMQEFRRLLEQYENRRGEPVTEVIISGGAAGFSELAQFVSYIFDRTVVTADPFAKVTHPAFMEDTLKVIGPTFTVALGAALRPLSE